MTTAPLAERMRPQSLDTFIGQEHLTADNGIIRQMLNNQAVSSMIFWGPPGVGKTTLASIIAQSNDLPFYSLSAIESGVKDIRQVIDTARKQGKVLLFIDEIHRFNKAQQDALLGAVEQGIITLIGATTENPSFEVINALLSRCQVFVLQEFTPQHLQSIVLQALSQDSILAPKQIKVAEWDALLYFSGGDGRKILNILELVVNSQAQITTIDNKAVENTIHTRMAQYDKSGEQHYDTISAFIKSIRGSDPNAAVYYLARMLAAGEDVKFIARRMIILASEDIGNANPNALLLATNAFQAVSMIGMPESRIILSQVATYLASSAKSNAAYKAIGLAEEIVKNTGDLSIPLSLRNAPTSLMKNLNYGKDYAYAHQYENHFVPIEFMPAPLTSTTIYQPTNQGSEAKLKEHLKILWGHKYDYK